MKPMSHHACFSSRDHHEHWTVTPKDFLGGGFSIPHHKCPAGGPEAPLLVLRTGGLLGVPELAGGDLHPDLSSWLPPAAWSTWAGEGGGRISPGLT